MKRVLALLALLAGVSILTHSAFAQKSIPSPVTQALEQEMKRAFALLQQKGSPPPYFISYSVRESESIDIETSHGALRSSQRDHSRLLDIDVRVGDYNLDNTHQLRGQRGANAGSTFSYPVLMPIDNDVDVRGGAAIDVDGGGAESFSGLTR